MTQRPRVAFIHDYEPMRRLVLELLPAADMDVYVAERSSVKLRALARWGPEVIVIDPIDGDGASKPHFKVANAIRRHPALGTRPMIVLAAERELLPTIGDLQPASILGLPFTADELVRAIRAVRTAPVLPLTPQRGPRHRLDILTRRRVHH
jgi:DNA-binding response OmpR family regulator